MPKFGRQSRKRLSECHPDLQELMNEVINIIDITILCGHRTKEEQNKAYNNNRTQLAWPNSNHNKLPSTAIDVAPYPIDWEDIPSFLHMCGIIETVADMKGIKIKLGRDFSFKDYPHVELDK